MVRSNQRAAIRATTRREIQSDEPWQQLQRAVLDALDRLEAANWRDGSLARDNEGRSIIIWYLPNVSEANGEIGFDADGRLLGFASSRKAQFWYDWYKGRAPNSWMFFARNVSAADTMFIVDFVKRIAT